MKSSYFLSADIRHPERRYSNGISLGIFVCCLDSFIHVSILAYDKVEFVSVITGIFFRHMQGKGDFLSISTSVDVSGWRNL